MKSAGCGAIDGARFERALDRIGAVFPFKSGRPKLDDVFDASFLPPAEERAMN
jgi:hypothetical protein